MVDAVGGFSATVAGNNFSTSQPIRQPQLGPIDGSFGKPFPFVIEKALNVESGTYTLMVWADRELEYYSRWMPTGTFGLIGCQIAFEFEDGQQETRVIVDGDSLGDVQPANCDR